MVLLVTLYFGISKIVKVTDDNINWLTKDYDVLKDNIFQQIKIGTSKEYVLDKFGVPKYNSEESLMYEFDNADISFVLHNDAVSGIEIDIWDKIDMAKSYPLSIDYFVMGESTILDAIKAFNVFNDDWNSCSDFYEVNEGPPLEREYGFFLESCSDDESLDATKARIYSVASF